MFFFPCADPSVRLADGRQLASPAFYFVNALILQGYCLVRCRQDFGEHTDDEGGQHQRRHPHPACHGRRLPPGHQDRLRAESAVPLLPADGGEAPQGSHPENLRGDNRG
ncbi:hypothetical protein Trydic_g2946 [Trypoxylus dichotomus]